VFEIGKGYSEMKGLIKGADLNTKQKQEVLNVFGYRWTVENKQRALQWLGNIQPPTIQPQTDEEWLKEHAFYFVEDGTRLSKKRRHCEPACLAD